MMQLKLLLLFIYLVVFICWNKEKKNLNDLEIINVHEKSATLYKYRK